MRFLGCDGGFGSFRSGSLMMMVRDFAYIECSHMMIPLICV